MATFSRHMKSVFGTKSNVRPARRTMLGMEALEAREVPSVTSIKVNHSDYYGTNQVDIRSNGSDGNIKISKANGQIKVTDSSNGFSETVSASGIQAILFFGSSGNDRVTNKIAGMPMRAYGFGGNDSLVGASGNDVLKGGIGNDTLIGNGGNDKLLGEEGKDLLKGMSGNDYVDGGKGSDSVFGGSGVDTFRRGLYFAGFNATQPEDEDEETDPADEPVEVSGAFLTDVRTTATRDSFKAIKQSGSATCSFMAALAAYAERTGDSNDLVQAIQYDSSDDEYGIRIYARGSWTTQWVNGDWTETRDPHGKLWVTLYQKAYLQAWGVTSRDGDGRLLSSSLWYSANGTDWQKSSKALDAITPGDSKWVSIGNASAATMETQIYSSATYGMVAGSKNTGTKNGVIANHSYMVYNAFKENGVWKICLYNPWGKDTANGALDSKNDGFITLTWSKFLANFDGYNRNS